MKKLLLVFCVTLLSFSFSFAQPPFAEGTIAIGGNLGFSTTTGDFIDETAFSIGPQFCYAVQENQFIGIQLSYSNIDSDGDEITVYGVNLMAESFPSKLSGNVGGLYFGSGFGISVLDFGGDDNLTQFEVMIDYGAWFNIAKNIQMKASMGELNWLTQKEGDLSGSIISMDLNPMANLNFTLKFLIPPSN